MTTTALQRHLAQMRKDFPPQDCAQCVQLKADLEAERSDKDRCGIHPAEPLELVCVECFESDRTAAANERAEVAEAKVAALQAQLDAIDRAQASWVKDAKEETNDAADALESCALQARTILHGPEGARAFVAAHLGPVGEATQPPVDS